MVRRLCAGDGADLQRACYPDQPLEAVRAYAAWCVRQMAKGWLVRCVAEVDGHVVANGQLTYQGGQAEIGSLIVAPSYRQRGIGRQLLRALVAEARQQGVASVVLTASVAEPWLRAWYEQEGFICVGERVLPQEEHVWVLQMPMDSALT